MITDDCLVALQDVPSNSVDLIITSPPYDGQPKYGDGEKYERDWYETKFLEISREILRVLKPTGSFVLNYRSRRRDSERGILQYELVFWLRSQGFLFCEDFVWGKPSPPPGRFNRFLKDAVEYCFQFAKSSEWQFFPEQCLSPARWDAKDRERRKRLAHNYERVKLPAKGGSVSRLGPIWCAHLHFFTWNRTSARIRHGIPPGFLCFYQCFIKIANRTRTICGRSLCRDLHDRTCARNNSAGAGLRLNI